MLDAKNASKYLKYFNKSYLHIFVYQNKLRKPSINITCLIKTVSLWTVHDIEKLYITQNVYQESNSKAFSWFN